ncbi:DUF1569 domain-containing protein [Flavobacterium pallidum]|uniref:DUF1569 domain-containing protein n=1 Tax=Flavobacterium pallidum TaxID=2172098 RepID=A0A2S1SIL5_9FLAO|nr:DUF1569 domain-containing protein [Flavobacterium pallidum]AWI26248.1 hypothetical protein HYN49_10240 [Flavobacterium pallidum]
MTSMFNPVHADNIISRIRSLTPEHEALWGKMNGYQMLKHCTLCEDMLLGHLKIKRVFIGRIIGKMILKKALEEGRPFGKNSPTAPLFETTSQSGNFEEQRNEWLGRISQYEAFSNNDFVHPFFGKMNREQVGLFAYKHADHHLRQFGV